ncbi:MAG: hypothetical protein WC426_07110 [Sulfuriferula sp.]
MSKPVLCPCCGKELFRLGVVSTDPLVLGKNLDGPHLESDQHGSFMRCPHCSKRVVFVSAPSQVGTGWRVGDTQPCADCQ